MLEAAIRYANDGLFVFPVHPGTKIAIYKDTFNIATTDPEKIREWWSRHPDANIGWYPHPSGHCVVDVDRGHDPIELPPTFVLETPSGGSHHVFEGECRSTVCELGKAIDTRGVGGYTLLPPSVIDERDKKASKDPTRCGVYRVQHDLPIAALPREIGERLSVRPDRPKQPRAHDEIDTPGRVARVRELAAACPGATNLGAGNQGGSDAATVKLANRLLDLCSEEIVIDAMMECWAPNCTGEWTEHYIRSKVERLAASVGTPTRRDEVGCQVDTHYPNPLPNKNGSQQAKSKTIIKNGATSKMQKIVWLWKPWLARGKFHILAGSGGAGKSTLCFDLMARLSNGGQWPDGSKAPQGDVLVWSGEDNFEDTILPRFVAAGGERSRLHAVAGILEDGEERAFDPAIDMPNLLTAATAIPDLQLVLIDPIVNAIGAGKDSHKNAEVRRGLQPVVDFAEARGVALVGITHFTKGTEGKDPTERVTGSLAFGALARIVMGASADEEGDQRRLVCSKSNIGPTGGGIEYRLQQTFLQADDMWAQKVVWGEKLQGTARALLSVAGQKALDSASTWLATYLKDGPVATKDVKEAAAAHGFSWMTIRRAQEKLGVVTSKTCGVEWGQWSWMLPPIEGAIQ